MSVRKNKQPKLRHDALDRISNDQLREALLDKLTVAELNELTRQIDVTCKRAAYNAAAAATEEAYKRQFAVTIRVLRDRFGFGRKRLKDLWDLCLEYINDIDIGKVTTSEMLECLANEDRIKITWRIPRDGEE